MKFIACLPPDAQSPVKPLREKSNMTRSYRIWLDAYLQPGQADAIMDHNGNFLVTLEPEPDVEPTTTSDDAKVVMASADGYDAA